MIDLIGFTISSKLIGFASKQIQRCMAKMDEQPIVERLKRPKVFLNQSSDISVPCEPQENNKNYIYTVIIIAVKIYHTCMVH